MYNTETNRLHKALLLRREIIGVRFLYFRYEYEKLDIPEYGHKTSYCMMVRAAMDGKHFRACPDNFGCRCSAEALGVVDEMPCVTSGERYYSIKLHETRAIAAAVTAQVARIPQRIYGIEIGPLQTMKQADLVLLMATPYQLMRLVEGYCYKFGPLTHIQAVGDQGTCADITAAPFVNNDMNYSVLCAGTRKMARWDDDEMGVGMPINQFPGVVDGVLHTLNYIEYPNRKQKIRDVLDSPDELGVDIRDDLHYGKEGKAFVNPQKYQALVDRQK